MYEKSFEIRYFAVPPRPEEVKLAPSGDAELAREEKDEGNGFNGSRWVYNQLCPGGHIGNPG